MTLGVVLGITALCWRIDVWSLSRAMLRPVAELTAWAEEVSAAHSGGSAAMPQKRGARGRTRLTGQFRAPGFAGGRTES